MKKPIIIGISAVLTIAFIFFGYSQVVKKNGGSKKELDSSVEYVTVEGRNATKSFSNKGTVELKDINKQEATIDGKISEVFFEVGDNVKAGDIIYTYDDSTLETLEDALKDAEINLSVTKINLESSKSSYNSLNETVEVTERDLLPLESQVHSAQTMVDEYNREYLSFDEDIKKAKENIQKAKDEFEKQKVLFDNGIITQKELDSFENIISDQEEVHEKILTQKENLKKTIETAEYNLDIANKNLEYAKNPEKTNMKSQKDQALNGIELSKISVAQAELTIERIKKQINEFKKEEVSTYTGTITSMTAVAGSAVQKGMKVMEVTDIGKDNLIVVLNVDQKNLKDVIVGQDVQVTSTGIGDEVVMGKIYKIMPTATINATTSGTESNTRVEVEFTEDVKGLKSGFLVECKVITEVKENVTFIPIQTLLTDEFGDNYLYIAKDDKIVEKRIVETGAVDGLDIEVTNVLAGEKVISSRLKLLKEGDTVNLIEMN